MQLSSETKTQSTLRWDQSTHMISKTLPSAVHVGLSKGVNVSLHRNTRFIHSNHKLERTRFLMQIYRDRDKAERKRKKGVRATVEGEALEGSAGFLGLRAAPLGGPLRLRDEHPVFAVLFLPHLSPSSRTRPCAIRVSVDTSANIDCQC